MYVCIETAGKISRLAEVCSPQDGNGAKAQTQHSVHHGAGSDSTSISADSPNSRHSQLTQHSTVSKMCNMNIFMRVVLFILELFGFYTVISESIYGRKIIPRCYSWSFNIHIVFCYVLHVLNSMFCFILLILQRSVHCFSDQELVWWHLFLTSLY